MMSAAAQTPKRVPAEQGSDPARSPVFLDLPLTDLSKEIRTRLAAFRFPSWLGSFGFCESYTRPPTQRLACLSDASGEIKEVIFYNERKWAGVFRQMEIVGPVVPESCLLHRLCSVRHPDLLTLSLQLTSDFPERVDNWRLLEVRRTAEDYRIDLPATCAEYLQQLGKQTRKHLPYYLRRIRREWPGRYDIRAAVSDEISWECFTRVLELNDRRMRTKARLGLWTLGLAKHRWPLFQKSGLLVSLHLGDEVVGGALCVLHCNEAFLVVIAHAPQFDRFNIGNVCLWQTIEHLIGIGCSAFHLLWGVSFYKTQFGGNLNSIYRITYGFNPRATAAWRLSQLLKLDEAASLAQRIRARTAGYGAFAREFLAKKNKGALKRVVLANDFRR